MTDQPANSHLPDAYAFRVDLTLEALRQHLNRIGPWEWIERDSAWYGDYISALPRPHDGIIKIYEEDDCFVIQLRYRALYSIDPDTVPDYRDLHHTILTRFLPSIAARDIRPDEGYD